MFIIYSKPACTFCDQAKALLASKNLEYLELVLDLGQKREPDKNYVFLRDLEALLPGVRTVPQIFERLDGAAPTTKYIGGFPDLKTYLAK